LKYIIGYRVPIGVLLYWCPFFIAVATKLVIGHLQDEW